MTNVRVTKCRVCNGSKPEGEFRELRDGRYVALAYCRDCKRRDDVSHNRSQRRRSRWA